MSYIFDLTREKVKKAIAELGIDLELLKVKTLDDFKEIDIALEISQLRLAYYIRKQQELTKLISEKINKVQNRNANSVSARSRTFMTQETNEGQKSLDIGKVQKFNRKRLINSLQKIEQSFLINQEIDLKIQQSREAKQQYLLQKKKKIIKGNSPDSKIEFQSKTKSADNSHSNIFKPALHTPKIKRLGSDVLQRVKFLNESTSNIDEKLKKIDEKIHKSQIIHQFHMNQKKTAMKKLLIKQFKKPGEEIDEENKRVLDYISKQDAHKERYNNLLAYQMAKRMKFKLNFEKKFADALSKANGMQNTKLKDTEFLAKMARSENVLKKKQENWLKKLEIRNEVQRLKEENVAIEIERVGNMMKFRREKTLEKHFLKSERVQKLNKEKELKVEQTLRILHLEMIEKEKLNEILASACKSPDHKHIKKKLVDLETDEKTKQLY